MKKLLLIVATLLVLAISGCAPQVDVEADAAAVRLVFEESTAALNAGATAILEFNTEDAVVMYANAPAVTGRDALRARQQAIHDQATFEETRSVDEVVVSDEDSKGGEGCRFHSGRSRCHRNRNSDNQKGMAPVRDVWPRAGVRPCRRSEGGRVEEANQFARAAAAGEGEIASLPCRPSTRIDSRAMETRGSI